MKSICVRDHVSCAQLLLALFCLVFFFFHFRVFVVISLFFIFSVKMGMQTVHSTAVSRQRQSSIKFIYMEQPLVAWSVCSEE